MIELLAKICTQIQEIFWKGYGDPDNFKAEDLTLPDADDWIPIAQMSTPCILTMRNYDATWEFEYSFSDKADVGISFPADTIISYNNMKGTLYARRLSSGHAVNINIGIIPVYMRE